jgi:uncharacterized protein (DUF1778 family)
MVKNQVASGRKEELSTEDRRHLYLTDNDRRVLVEALINPKPINDRLRDTVRRYSEATGV